MKYFNYKKRFLITSGSSDHYWNKNKLNVPIIKSPTTDKTYKVKRGKNVIFVDEFRFFRRDTHLYGITEKNKYFKILPRIK